MTAGLWSHRVGVLPGDVPLVYDDLRPTSADSGTIVLVHGGCLSGSSYQVTPDGRPGWAADFLHRGYRVVVPDWPGVGRSSGIRPERVNGEVVAEALGSLLEEMDERVVLLVHSMSGPYGFYVAATRRPLLRALVAVAPGPPGELQAVPEPVRDGAGWTFAHGGRTMTVPESGFFYMNEDFARRKMIGPSTRFPRGGLDALLRMSAATPVGCVLDRTNLHGRQLRLDGSADLEGLPVLVVTGESDTDHPVAVDARVAARLSALGAQVDHHPLAVHGLTGNGHLPMSEINSSRIAGLMAEWIGAYAPGPR